MNGLPEYSQRWLTEAIVCVILFCLFLCAITALDWIFSRATAFLDKFRMPKAALQPCAKVGCKTLVERAYCSEHQKAIYKAQDDHRESSTKRGYDATWRKLRRMILAQEPLCRECLKTNRITEACEVDHIKPIRFGGERLNAENLQPLCKSCHSRKTLRESVD